MLIFRTALIDPVTFYSSAYIRLRFLTHFITFVQIVILSNGSYPKFIPELFPGHRNGFPVKWDWLGWISHFHLFRIQPHFSKRGRWQWWHPRIGGCTRQPLSEDAVVPSMFFIVIMMMVMAMIFSVFHFDQLEGSDSWKSESRNISKISLRHLF